MIKIFKIDSLRYTPFDPDFDAFDYGYLESAGLQFTDRKSEADLFLAYDSKKMERFVLRNPLRGPYLLWTNEPRLSQRKEVCYRPFPLLPKVQLMNVYTGDVFVNNITYQKGRFLGATKLERLQPDFRLGDRKVAALMSYYNAGLHSSLYIEGQNIDLVRKRSQIGIYGHQHGLMDIYGRGWPEGISREDSRSGAWTERKSTLLEPYRFNLCFENTVYPQYITEKIWDSIEAHCLPIYYGGLGSTIYELFEPNSFMDYAQYESPEALFASIQQMDDGEYRTRMNSCIDTYNDFCDRPESFWNDQRKRALDKIVEKCRLITGRST